MRIANTISERISEYRRELGIGTYTDTFSRLFEDAQDVPSNAIYPGHIFTFQYQIPNPVKPQMIPSTLAKAESMIKEGIKIPTRKPYIDYNPTGMCLGFNKGGNLLFLNFRVMPPKPRLLFLEKYWNAYKNVINSAHEIVREKDENGKIVEKVKPIPYMDRRRNASQMSPFQSVTPQKLKGVGMNLDFAINNYETRYISGVKVIDWDQIHKIPFGYVNSSDPSLVISEGVSNLGEIYERFDAKR